MDGYQVFVEVLHGRKPPPPPPPPADNPSSLVLINVKAGRTHLLKKLEFLHSKKALMDMEMTWVEAFDRHFNYRIDPNQYLIQKHSLGVKDARRHELTAQIKEMLPEFPKRTKEFKVYLVTNNSHVVNIQPLPPLEPPPPKIPWWNKEGGNTRQDEIARAVQSITNERDKVPSHQQKGWPTPLNSLPPNTIIAQDNDNKIILRATVKGKDEWMEWLLDFQRRTNTKWIVRHCIADPKNFTFMKDYICQHSEHNKVKNTEYRSDRNADCRVQLKVRVKKDSKDTRYRDKYIKLGYPCVIRLLQKYHSHPLNTDEALFHLRPSKESEENFLRYYKQGLSVSEAMSKNAEWLRDQHRDKGDEEFKKKILNNASLHPKNRSIYHFYNRWKKEGVERRKVPADRRTRDGRMEAALPEDPMPDLNVNFDNDGPDPPDVDMEVEVESSTVEPEEPNQNRSPPRRPRTPPLPTTSPDDLMLNEIGTTLFELGSKYGGVDPLYKLIKSIKTKEDWDAFVIGKRPGTEKEKSRRRRDDELDENEVRKRMMGVIIKPVKVKGDGNIQKKKKPITRKRNRKHLTMLIKEDVDEEWSDSE